jgi:hypothetical protein
LLSPSWEYFVSLLPKNANIKYTKLQLCPLFGMGVKLGLSQYRKNTDRGHSRTGCCGKYLALIGRK